jgi:hypothetical protein
MKISKEINTVRTIVTDDDNIRLCHPDCNYRIAGFCKLLEKKESLKFEVKAQGYVRTSFCYNVFGEGL